MLKDKRKSKRSMLLAPVRYQLTGTQSFGNCIGRDISDSGIGFTSNEFFPVSTHLIFEVRHPESRIFIKAEGEIVWISHERHAERYLVGSRFISKPSQL